METLHQIFFMIKEVEICTKYIKRHRGIVDLLIICVLNTLNGTSN